MPTVILACAPGTVEWSCRTKLGGRNSQRMCQSTGKLVSIKLGLIPKPVVWKTGLETRSQAPPSFPLLVEGEPEKEAKTGPYRQEAI